MYLENVPIHSTYYWYRMRLRYAFRKVVLRRWIEVNSDPLMTTVVDIVIDSQIPRLFLIVLCREIVVLLGLVESLDACLLKYINRLTRMVNSELLIGFCVVDYIGHCFLSGFCNDIHNVFCCLVQQGPR